MRRIVERLALGPIDFMVLDLNMPDMHALEVLRFVRSNQKFQRREAIDRRT